jgi:hypothetical protein
MMKNVQRSLTIASFIVALYSCCQAQDWRKIGPLKSTRADVEAMLGPAEGGYAAVYQLKEGSLSIEYSSGPCRPERKGGWNVPENVVVSVSFSPKHPRRISSFKLDPKKFRKEIGQHVGGVIYYINDDEGITYEVQSGKVDAIEYDPPKRYSHLHCGDAEDQKVPSH